MKMWEWLLIIAGGLYLYAKSDPPIVPTMNANVNIGTQRSQLLYGTTSPTAGRFHNNLMRVFLPGAPSIAHPGIAVNTGVGNPSLRGNPNTVQAGPGTSVL